MFHLTLCYGSLVPCSSNGSLSSLPAMFRWVFPHCCIASMIGDRVLPKSVRLYSVFGGKDDTRPVSGSFYVTTSSKYSFTSFTTTPDNKNTAIRFGITISPLNVSAMFHISPRFMVAPTIATNAYKIMNGLFARVPNKNSIHLVP